MRTSGSTSNWDMPYQSVATTTQSYALAITRSQLVVASARVPSRPWPYCMIAEAVAPVPCNRLQHSNTAPVLVPGAGRRWRGGKGSNAANYLHGTTTTNPTCIVEVMGIVVGRGTPPGRGSAAPRNFDVKKNGDVKYPARNQPRGGKEDMHAAQGAGTTRTHPTRCAPSRCGRIALAGLW